MRNIKISKKVSVKQHDQSDCGAACMASVLAYYGRLMPISLIRRVTCTDKRGTNVLGLVEAASELGFACKGVKAVDDIGVLSIDILKKVPKPTIAHIVYKNNLQHFVVIYKVTDKYVFVMDPAVGEIEKWTIDSFINRSTGVLVLLVPNDDFVKVNQKNSISSRFWFLFKPHTNTYVQALVGSLIYTILGLATSIGIQKIIDQVIPDGNYNLLNLICVILVFSTILSAAIGYVRALMLMRSGIMINAKLILGYYKHLLTLPQSFFDSMRSGEIISRISDAAKINTFINDALLNIVVNVFTIIVAFALMFQYYWKLALIMLVAIPIYAMIYLIYNAINKKVQRKIMEEAADLQSQLVESINSSSTIKCFGIESFTNQKTENRYVRLARTGWDSGKYSLVTSTLSNSFSSLFVTLLLWIGTSYVLQGIITPGELMSFHTLTGYFLGPAISLVGVNRVFQDAKIAAERLFEIFDLEPEEANSNIRISKEEINDIRFENVKFRYGTRENVFDDLSITFKKGQVNAIVGESGSGKTTIASLIQNLYTVQSGNIFIGSHNIKDICKDDLRKFIGVVPQKMDLFHGSIADNIILDDYSPDWERVNRICNEVGIREFMEKLPNGLNTLVGENGTQLSGGQRQRIAIARALYKNPEVLILDEATSALDSTSEIKIKELIHRLKEQGKTVILIAHRLGTILEADEIFVLQNGSVAEQGSHNQLMKNRGLYHSFWINQTKGYEK